MSMLHQAGVEDVLAYCSRTNDPVLQEMEDRAAEEAFPTVGPEVGSWLSWLVSATEIQRVFECGSGFGYSGYWMAQSMTSDGELVLTDLDPQNLADAREWFSQGDVEPRVRFEQGDAIAILEAEQEVFDLILLDHENERYVEGLDVALVALRDGGLIIADNILHSYEFSPEDVANRLISESLNDANPSLAGVVAYYQRVLTNPQFTTTLLPLGEGVLVSTKHSTDDDQ